MKIASPFYGSKSASPRRRRVFSILERTCPTPPLTLLWVLSACAPATMPAPFYGNRGSVERGSLLGPFDGRVVDAASHKPIEGALVYLSWGYVVGEGLRAPAGGRTAMSETDRDGHYWLPAHPTSSTGRALIEKVTLIVYKRGYIAYRSDRRFEDEQPRRDFVQRDNEVVLERFPQRGSHVEHIRFIGGGGVLREVLAPERIQASLELSRGEPLVEPVEKNSAVDGLLDAGDLLSEEELKATTGYEGSFELLRLGDLERSSTYDSRHFRAVERPESYDAAIRAWKLPTSEAAEAEFERLLDRIPGRESVAHLGTATVRGHEGKIFAAATWDRDRHVVLQLTCGSDQCRDMAQVEGLLRRLLARADRLETTQGGAPRQAGSGRQAGTVPDPPGPASEIKK
jgi:hypothetical protein